MKVFQCDHCGQPVYFDNERCENCGSVLGFLPSDLRFVALTPEGDGWRARAQPDLAVQFCQNHAYDACQWLVEAGGSETFCPSCRLNRTIPPLDVGRNLEAWRSLERGKRRLIYSLLRLGLPLASKLDDLHTGLAFDFLSEEAATNGPVLTGHAHGLITLNIAEANPVHRERLRHLMGEPYRTIVGHFRHEIGHFYWERLLRTDPQALEGFRTLFGDERADYGQALAHHYAQGPVRDWPSQYLSAYAAVHPWEDWAETWAHYLHLLDMLETAHSFGVSLAPHLVDSPAMHLPHTFDPYEETSVEAILAAALPLTLAVNSLNRGMGQPDVYPFVLPPPVVEKLRFIHGVIRHHGVGENRQFAPAG